MFLNKFVRYTPILTVITLFIWPNIMLNMDTKTFPIINLLGFGIRISEILFSILLMLYFLITPPTNIKIVFTNRLLIIYTIVVLSFLLIFFSLIQGLLNGNPNILLDIRGIFYSFFVIIFIGYIKSINEIRISFKYFYYALVLLAIINLFTFFIKSNLTIGTFSNVELMLILYLICFTLAIIAHYTKYRLHLITILFIAILCCIVSLQKQVFLGLIVAFFSFIFLIEWKKGKKIIFYSIVGLIIFIFLFYFLINKTGIFENIFGFSLDIFMDSRIYRTDVGDISGGRFDMWNQIINDAIINPFYGKGLGVEGFQFDTIEIPVHEHNIIMWSLRRFSVIGTSIFLILSILYFNFTRYVYKKENNKFKKTLIFLSLIYGIVYFAVNMVMLTPFVFEAAILFWFNGSIVYIIHKEQLQSRFII